MRRFCLPSISGSCLLLVLCAPLSPAAKTGFGSPFRGKKELELKTRQPARVRLANTSIAFRGSFSNPEYAPVLNSLMSTLGTELISNEKTIQVKDKAADAAWVLGLTVNG